jgi:hypothetical protein
MVSSRGDCFNKDQDVINTCMNKYLASVRIRGQIVKMAVFADSMIHARLILEYQFGMNSLATIPVQVNEAGTIKLQTSDQARLAALKRQKDNVAKQIEAERERKKIYRAQQQISQAIRPKSPSVRLSDA